MTTLEGLKIILNLFEAAACLTGFIFRHKVKNTHWKWLPWYLLIIITAELLGKYLTYQGFVGLKVMMYQYLVIPLEILFFLSMFVLEFKNSKAGKFSLTSIGIFILSFLLDSFINSKFQWFLSFSYTIGVLLIVINILIFLFKLITSNEILHYRSNFVFWICVGLLIFYLCSIPVQGIFTTLYTKNKIFMPFAYLFYVFNCLMYLSFTIAFIWGKVKSQDS